MARVVHHHLRIFLALLLALVSLLPERAEAQPSWGDRTAGIPESLRPWIPWALSGAEQELCPQVGEQRVCVWPSSLRIEAEEKSGRFELGVEAQVATKQELPGGPGLWPQKVTVNGKPALVMNEGGRPALELSPGRHVVRGEFYWPSVPDTLPLSGNVAFVRVSVQGKELPLVKRDDSKVWLQGGGLGAGTASEQEGLTLSVYRRIQDGVLMTIETRLVFEVSGRARELLLKAPFVPSSVPLRVSGDLALRLEPNLDLRVQLVPGRHELVLVARPLSPDGPLVSPVRESPWPGEEIWTFAPEPSIRSVELRGLSGIDASRTDLPSEWRNQGAYLARPGDELTIVNTRRGLEQIPNNQIHLRRTFWLDETAEAYTVLDRLTGEMHKTWRLELLSGELGSVRAGGQSQVVTSGPEGARGVEVRESRLDLTAVSRVPRSSSLAAVGWSEDVRSLSAEVYLPPGFSVLAAFGVDRPRGTWVDRWDLFDLFYVLILAIAVHRLLGRAAGFCALVALVLLRGETGAPEYYWMPLIALGALASFLPPGTWQKMTRAAFFLTALSLTISIVTFTVSQVRSAIYPHLDRDHSFVRFDAWPGTAPEPQRAEIASDADNKEGGAGLALPVAPPSDIEEQAPLKRKVQSSTKKDMLLSASDQLKYRPDAVAQSGPGLPESVGNSWHFEWTGPVVKDHSMRLLLLPPLGHRILTLLRVLSLLALSFLVFRHFWPFMGPSEKVKATPAPVASAALLALVAIFVWPSSASAQEPSDARLQELRARLLKPAPCEPNCLSVSALKLDLGQELTLEAEVHAGAPLAYRLPGPATVLASPRVLIDGRPEVPAQRGSDGALYVRLEPGVHQVRLVASLESERLTLDLGTLPERVTVKADGWLVSGINELGQAPSGALTLQREARLPTLDGKDKSVVDNIPPFFIVHRTLDLAVTPAISTVVRRVSDAGLPEQLQLPLVLGERVITAGLETEKLGVILGFPAETTERSFQSSLTLPEKEGKSLTLTLSAPSDQPYLEVWTVRCGIIYHCETEGIVPSSYLEDGRSVTTFHPRQGESLTIVVHAPEPASGEYITVQNAHLTTVPGVRSSETTLSLALEVTRSMVHSVKIPEQARVERVTIDGVSEAVKFTSGSLMIPLHPGSPRVEIVWQEPVGISAVFRAPAVDLGAASVNLRTSIALPSGRWLLWVGGPAQGPALLYWGYLIVLILAGWVLSRLPYAPLRFYQWLLLGLGLTQVPAAIAVWTAGWFFLIGSRRHWPKLGRFLHNFVHLGVIVYSITFLSALLTIVYAGLVSSPDMEIVGAGSHSGQLTWYVDRSQGRFEPAYMFTVSVWVWRVVMLAWSFWLATSLLGWLKWAYSELREGEFWKSRSKTAPPKDLGVEVGQRGPEPVSEVTSSAPPGES